MRYSRSSAILLILGVFALGGCASKQPERRLTMPNWFDGYDREEQEEKSGEDYEAESTADASDRIQEEDQTAVTDEPASADAEEAAAESAETTSDTESQPAEQTADAPEPAKPKVKLPPRPKPLAAKNEQQALAAQQAKPRFEAALERMKDGDLNAALVLFQEISAQFPSLAGPIVNQAIILRTQEKYDDAKSVLQSALLNKAQNPYLMNELGLVHRQLGNFEAAKQAYLSAIRIEPNYDKAHYNLAVLADLYLHDPALAYEEFQIYQSLQVEPDKKVAGWLKEIERRLP